MKAHELAIEKWKALSNKPNQIFGLPVFQTKPSVHVAALTRKRYLMLILMMNKEVFGLVGILVLVYNMSGFP